MIDPARVCLYVPPGLKKFKLNLFERIGERIVAAGGSVARGDDSALRALPREKIPVVGCSPHLRPIVQEWIRGERDFIYWDRGYCRRVFATHLPRGENGGMYRWHLNSFQMTRIRDVTDNRWRALETEVSPWRRDGGHVVIAQPTPNYRKFHGIETWTDETVDALSSLTDRQLVIRGKLTKRTLQEDLEGAHAMVAHGSNAAVEAVILGCPVFVAPCSAAALVGQTDLEKIETPAYPDREPWLRSLAYSQFSEQELVDGTLWRLMT